MLELEIHVYISNFNIVESKAHYSYKNSCDEQTRVSIAIWKQIKTVTILNLEHVVINLINFP